MRLTTEAARDEAPSWSRDGKWIYFASQRSGRWETWRVPAGGGEAVRMTRTGGGTAFESSDGQSVYYVIHEKDDWSGSLWKIPVSGGGESQVLPSVV
jgi:eukaryotic-like serine/threonine-protein kinase